jgi:REP element-mobilizing transposase RayT
LGDLGGISGFMQEVCCIWTLPPGDSDYLTRLRLIKGFVSKQCGHHLILPSVVSASRQKRRERNLWQRRFWEHLIRDGIESLEIIEGDLSSRAQKLVLE